MAIYQHDIIVPYKDSSESKKKQVEQMFDKIAFRYDFMNHFLSGGVDIRWRKRAIKQLKDLAPRRLLDVATGTGDLALLAYKILKPGKIIGIDISGKMLEMGRQKIEKLGLQSHIELLKGDCETINYDDDTFDAVT